MKKNYKIFELEDNSFKYMVLRLFCHDSKQQWKLIEDELSTYQFEGWVLLDNLFKGGNISTRFSKVYFDKKLDINQYLVLIEDNNKIRSLTSKFLSENDLAKGSSLTEEEIKLITKGQII